MNEDKNRLNMLFHKFAQASALHAAIHGIDLNYRHTLTNLDPEVAKMKQVIMDRAVVEIKEERNKCIKEAVAMYNTISLD